MPRRRAASAPLTATLRTPIGERSTSSFPRGERFFEPCYKGKSDGRLEAAVIGRHNLHNALAVYALGRTMGIEQADLIDGFRTFAGVKRRQEIRGEQRGILVFDDFAHHPTAVRETIEAIRAAYQGRRIWAVFEPRSNTSKRNLFEHEFAAALALADRVLIAPVYQPEKIPDGERLSVDRVVSRDQPARRRRSRSESRKRGKYRARHCARSASRRHRAW